MNLPLDIVHTMIAAYWLLLIVLNVCWFIERAREGRAQATVKPTPLRRRIRDSLKFLRVVS